MTHRWKAIFAAVALFTLPIEAEANSTCGGNCPGGCTSCPCGNSQSFQSISAWCAKFTGWSQQCCQCILKAESGGNANAVNQNSGGSQDVGLWQINTTTWKVCSGGAPPCNPSANLQCAITVWQQGRNSFKLWSTCGKCGCC